ncbi:hypothetical protein BH09PSE5_BH09PSE5_37070 [soil metagenome]
MKLSQNTSGARGPARADDAGENALSSLRSVTKSLHEELDRRLPLSQPNAGIEAYIDHLQHLRTWLGRYAAWEAEAIAGQPVEPSPRKQQLLARMDADLSDSSVPASIPAVAEKPAAKPAPLDMRQAAYRWGVDYVVEGSQLGGTVLYRRLEAGLAPHPLTYLRGDGAETGARWRAFMADLQREVSSQNEISLACRGAVDAFSSLMESFGLVGPQAEAEV